MEKIRWRCLSGTNDFEPDRISTELAGVLAVRIEDDRFAGSGLNSFERFISKSTGIAQEVSAGHYGLLRERISISCSNSLALSSLTFARARRDSASFPASFCARES